MTSSNLLLTLAGTGPLYLKLYRALREAVLEGRLRAGDRLPSTRALARELAVSRNVALQAYDQLLAEGYLESRLGSGTYVARELPQDFGDVARRPRAVATRSAETPIRLSRYGRNLERLGVKTGGGPATRRPLRFDFRHEVHRRDEFPVDVWRRLVSRHLAGLSTSGMDYGSSQGHQPLRQALARYLGRARSVLCEADQVVITDGSQQGLDLIARMLLDPDDGVVLEDPHYPRARHCFAAHGVRLLPIPVDERGLRVDELERQAAGARLVYVTPSHQYPTGAILPVTRRLQLLDWAATHDAFVVEDDYDSEFRYSGRPIEAIQGLDRGRRVLYVGSFSKSLFPALRIGYLVLPPDLAPLFAAAKALSDRHSSTLVQQVLADFIAEGHFERHLRRAVIRCGARRASLVAAVTEHLGERVTLAGTGSGLHALLWLRDRPPAAAEAVVERAADAGVGLYSVAYHHLRPPEQAGLLLRYGAMAERDIHDGIATLATVLD